MDFAYSPKVQELRERVTAFMDTYVYPAEAVFERQVAEGDRWQPTAIMEELKAKAKAEGLWNLFLPESELGAGLTNLEYAPLAEIMGRSLLGPEPFNCSAPDTGNMEVLVRYGTDAQRKQWLEPLLAGKIRSCFFGTNRFQRPAAFALRLSSPITGGSSQRSPARISRSNTGSAG